MGIDHSYLDTKFERLSYFDTPAWLMHKWINYGADFGFILIWKDEHYSLLTYEDSGYSKSKVVFQDMTEKQVWHLCECFSPTNDTYKTD